MNPHPSTLLSTKLPYAAGPAYRTDLGAAYVGDSAYVLRDVPDDSIDLVFTSPPYALIRKKAYGNVSADDYLRWIRPVCQEIHRILKPSGSFVLNVAGTYNAGVPTRTLYHYRTLLMLCDELGFHLAQECFWHSPTKMPVPAEWVNVRRVRIKDSVEFLWWLSKTPHPKADNRRVLVEYSASMRHIIDARRIKTKVSPSGHVATEKFLRDNGGAIPSNLLIRSPSGSGALYLRRCRERGIASHPARFPEALPDFFIWFLTEPGDIVLDPFAGSNTTGAVAEGLGRRWISIELDPAYVEASRLRWPLEESSNAP